jgi:hypothetical protein
MSRLDDSTIDEIGRLLCGDDGPLYRKGWELQNLLCRAGIADVPEYDGSPRRLWTNEVITGGEGNVPTPNSPRCGSPTRANTQPKRLLTRKRFDSSTKYSGRRACG